MIRFECDLPAHAARGALEALELIVALGARGDDARTLGAHDGLARLRDHVRAALAAHEVAGLPPAWTCDDLTTNPNSFADITLEYRTDPRRALGVLEALEAVTQPYAAPEIHDAPSAREYLVGLRDAWRVRLPALRGAVARWDAEMERLF